MFPVSITWNICCFQKPEELKEESVPDGEQKGLFYPSMDRKLKAKTYLDKQGDKKVIIHQVSV